MTLDYDGWIILIGVLVALCCAIPGSWLVVRGMGMMGDAISHAVLPGIAIGFLMSGARSSGWMFLGAAVAGVLAAGLTHVIHRRGRVEQGAAMGLVFTTFFAIGLVLIVQFADAVHLDPNCVLYGAIELAPLDTMVIGGVLVPRIVIPLVLILILNMALTVVFFKQSLLAAFDPALSHAQGFDPKWMHHGLMVATAATCVACFEAVGSIITVALLVAPAATALLLTRSMKGVLCWSMIMGSVATSLGHVSAVTLPQWWTGSSLEMSSAGMMAVSATVCFLGVAFVAPGRGVLAKAWKARRDAMQVALEDAIGLLYRLEERGEEMAPEVVEGLWRSDVRIGHRFHAVLATLRRRALADRDWHGWRLSDAGRDQARHLVRAHRLWETYLAGHANIPSSHLHSAAERLEHITDAEMAMTLQREVGDVSDDPHGRAIPPADEMS